MRAINHALTGAVIGLAIAEPVAAVPLAIVSHYVCDAIPHYGQNDPDGQKLRSSFFRRLLYFDAILCFGLVVLLAINQPINWQLAVICAFLATAPDLFSINKYRHALTHTKWHPNLYSKLATGTGIQWFERPIGVVVEIAWFMGAIALLIPFLR
jgi:hypothetical protein